MNLPQLTRQIAYERGLIRSTDRHTARAIGLGSGRYIQNHPLQLFHAADFGGVVLYDFFDDKNHSTQARVDDLNSHDLIYTSVLRGLVNGEPTIQATVIDDLAGAYGPSSMASFLALGSDPYIELIFSQTTEKGMYRERVMDGTLAEADKYQNGLRPQASAPGNIAAFLIEKYRAENAKNPLIWIPTELIENQGDLGLQGVRQLLAGWGFPEISDSLDKLLIVGNNVVDRICTGEFNDPAFMAAQGYTGLFTAAEPFQETVIADPTGKIRERVDLPGVTYVDSKTVSPAFWKKYGLLNCGHTTLVSVGIEMGIKTVRAAVEDPLVGAYLKALQSEVIMGYRNFPYSRHQLTEYAAEIIDRFRNPFIEHNLSAIALNHADKMQNRLRNVAERFAPGSDMRHMAFSFAAGLYHLNGHTADVDVQAQMVKLNLLGDLPSSILAKVQEDYNQIAQKGMRHALEAHMGYK